MNATATTLAARVRRQRNAARSVIGRIERRELVGRNHDATERTLWAHVAKLNDLAVEAETAGDDTLAEQAWAAMQAIERFALKF
jgi:hypothetical protein